MIPNIENKKPIYIMSLDASDIYYHNYREMNIKYEYYGMIPFSLESLKLVDVGLKTKYIESRDKFISNDIINVKFKSKVRSANEMVDIYENKIKYAKDNDKKYQDELIAYKHLLEEHSTANEYVDDLWGELSVSDIRKELYKKGFKIKFKNSRTGNIKEVEYVVYKRSSAKSRTGQCLFIKKSLYKKMIDWSRMYLPFKTGQKIDLASLLAYESLVGSSLEDTIKIDPYKILIVDDVESKFKKVCNVVRKNEETGFLDSFKEEVDVVNSLFDGESLLESKYFKDGTGMILLRNHMFKSAAFNCNIQKFLKDKCPKDIVYEEWKIKDMYGNPMNATDIEMIITPSSLKALKFLDVLPEDNKDKMWNYWRELVSNEGSLFGICKHEKKSKIGVDAEGSVLQQTSYQMINCLPVNKDDIEKLLEKEKEYITKLKTDNDFLMDEIHKFKDVTNSNEAIYSLYHHNKELINTKLFRNFKKTFVKKRVSHAKKGKIKIKGDYCVLLGNPLEFLYHAIGEFNVDEGSKSLTYNNVYTTLYKFDEDLIGFRNPNTSPSNVLIVRNTYNNDIDNYFNLTSNIVCVNAIKFAIQDILSGCDYDSDTMLLSSEEKLVDIGKRCFEKYDPCINKIKGSPKRYELTKHDHFEIDNQLSHSQRNIGKVVNLGQFSMSVYWDLINNGEQGKDIDELLKKVDVMTVLSGIAIDMAKKFYDIDMDREIRHVQKNEKLKLYNKKPLFWIYVSQSKTIKNRVEKYECPMDYLIEGLNELEIYKDNNIIHFDEFLVDSSVLKVDTRQINNIKDLLESYSNDVKALYSKNNTSEDFHRKIEFLNQEYCNKIKKWKLKDGTISLLIRDSYNAGDSFLLKIFKLLHESHQEKLLKNIKKG